MSEKEQKNLACNLQNFFPEVNNNKGTEEPFIAFSKTYHMKMTGTYC